MENSTYKYNYVTQIRDLVIGIGRPKIAASIMAYNEESFLEKARLADEVDELAARAVDEHGALDVKSV